MLSRLARLAGATVLSLVAASATAQSPAPRMIGGLNVANLCSAVDSQAYELEPIHDSILYQYQTLLYRAAGVQAADPEAAVNEKLRRFINANLSAMKCNMINFNPRHGNILKLGVARQADPFIDDVIRNWKVDLNHVDALDGFTMLDYAEQRMDTYKPDKLKTRPFEDIYRRLRKAGAKHRFELAASGAALPQVESAQAVLARLESKAKGGDFFSAIRLASIYQTGRILNGPIAPDPAKMRQWLALAGNLALASRSVSDAHWLGMFHGGINERAAELSWYAKAVELAGNFSKDMPPRGIFDASLELAKAYSQGDGVASNLDLALSHATRANETAWSPGSSAIPVSQRWMGFVYEQRGDIDKAARWYRTARYAFTSKQDPPSVAAGIQPWLTAKGLPKCGVDIYGNKDC
ncbi:MAG: hypothetical protein NBV68_13570 [Erythrobacter sp.]|uniref:hypothetical protein n=1 Tax=Erythrobacter sp. TaxID=1042 RepID=UPI0025DEC82C|nr:hypothetical protein [Erythrobacter sp.]MCM0000408.1 hypothetical protein [Erythrobacter sp.]